MKVYEAIADAIAAEGCTAVFGVMGDGNMALWSALSAGSTKILSTRHEAAAVSAADGFARVRGGIGVATVTNGPGMTHAATPLIAASRHRVPLVLIVGDTADPTHPQKFEQQRFAEACEAGFVSLTGTEDVAARLAEAFSMARQGRRAIVLNVPLELTEQVIPKPYAYRPTPPPPVVSAPDADALRPVVEALKAAKRPVIVAGRGAVASGAKDALIALADTSGALLGTSLLAKGMFDGHPYNIGVIGGFASDRAEYLMGKADLVVAFGAQLSADTNAAGGKQFANAKIARVDIETGGTPSDLFLHADAALAATALKIELQKSGPAGLGFRISSVDSVLGEPPPVCPAPNDGLDPRAMMAELSRTLPTDVQITSGVGHFWGFPVMNLTLPKGGAIEFSYAFGAIGSGLPMAIGAATATPDRPNLLIEGDGSILQHLQELETVVRLGLQLVVLVMNDAGYGAEVFKLKTKNFAPALAQWTSPDFVAVARALGGDGALLRSENQLGDLLRQGLDHGGLFLIDARVSPTTPSDRYEKAFFGRKLQDLPAIA